MEGLPTYLPIKTHNYRPKSKRMDLLRRPAPEKERPNQMTDQDNTAGIALLAQMLSPEMPNFDDVDIILDMGDSTVGVLWAALLASTNLMRTSVAIDRQRVLVKAMALQVNE